MIELNLIIIIVVYFLIWFFINTLLKNAGLIDIAWGLGFVLLAITQYVNNISSLGLILLMMVAIWGLRLSWHIGKRNINNPEDHRYQKFRNDWGKHYILRAIFQIYILQAILMLIVSMTFLDGIKQSELKSLVGLIIGAIVYSIGLGFEVISDYQMEKFKKDIKNKGQLMTSGLWSLSRHPNYFGEATLWLGIAITSISIGSNLVALIGAFTIFYLVRFLSGTPLMEKRIKEYEEFKSYEKEVPIFFPKLKGALKK